MSCWVVQINEGNQPDGSVRIFLCSQITISNLKFSTGRLLNRRWADGPVDLPKGKSHFLKDIEVVLGGGGKGLLSAPQNTHTHTHTHARWDYSLEQALRKYAEPPVFSLLPS